MSQNHYFVHEFRVVMVVDNIGNSEGARSWIDARLNGGDAAFFSVVLSAPKMLTAEEALTFYEAAKLPARFEQRAIELDSNELDSNELARAVDVCEAGDLHASDGEIVQRADLPKEPNRGLCERMLADVSADDTGKLADQLRIALAKIDWLQAELSSSAPAPAGAKFRDGASRNLLLQIVGDVERSCRDLTMVTSTTRAMIHDVRRRDAHLHDSVSRVLPLPAVEQLVDHVERSCHDLTIVAATTRAVIDNVRQRVAASPGSKPTTTGGSAPSGDRAALDSPPSLSPEQGAVLARYFNIGSGEFQRRVVRGDEDDYLAEMIDAFNTLFEISRTNFGHDRVPIGIWETYMMIKRRNALVSGSHG
jgi:hypothetical protein